MLNYSIFRCNHEGCDKVYSNLNSWRTHIKVYHLVEGSGGVTCDVCGSMWQNFFFLNRHKSLAHNEVNCKDCPQVFMGKNALFNHKLKVHLTGNEHICELCGMGFKMKIYLKRHTRQQHPGVIPSPFFCIECEKPFGTGRKLQDHTTAFHTKTRPYKCRAGDQICDKSFSTINLRKRHEKQVHKLFIQVPKGSRSAFVMDPPGTTL